MYGTTYCILLVSTILLTVICFHLFVSTSTAVVAPAVDMPSVTPSLSAPFGKSVARMLSCDSPIIQWSERIADGMVGFLGACIPILMPSAT